MIVILHRRPTSIITSQHSSLCIWDHKLKSVSERLDCKRDYQRIRSGNFDFFAMTFEIIGVQSVFVDLSTDLDSNLVKLNYLLNSSYAD